MDWVMMQVPDGTDWIEYMLHLSAQPTRGQLGSEPYRYGSASRGGFTATSRTAIKTACCSPYTGRQPVESDGW